MTQPLLIDVDTGVDDALAIALLVNRNANLIAFTTVQGNVPVEVSTPNTLSVLTWLGAGDIPVHRGASRPLANSYLDAAHVHGNNGLGGAELDDVSITESPDNAISAILRAADEFAGELVVLCTGPLTNLAIALSIRPELTNQIRKLVIMGGAFTVPGNVQPWAEFNIYADPHAAQQVFAANWNEAVAVGLDVTHQTVISGNTWAGIQPRPHGSAELARRILGRTFTERKMLGFYLHDPLAALLTLEPDLATYSEGSVEVDTNSAEPGRTRFTPGSGSIRVAATVQALLAEQTICRDLGIDWVDHQGAIEQSE